MRDHYIFFRSSPIKICTPQILNCGNAHVCCDYNNLRDLYLQKPVLIPKYT